MSRNIESDYEFTDNQFLSQECFLVSLKIAFWFIMTSGVVLSPLLLENRLGTDKKKELVSTYLITVFSTVIAVLCLNVTCWVYTSCYRPLNHYCKQVSKLRVIQNDINNAKMTNTLFANNERAGFNDDSSESSPMEEGLLSNFIDEAELCEETLEYNTTAGRVKTP